MTNYCGVGSLTLPNGINFTGNFKNGKIDGNATQAYPDGSKYFGEFKEGIKNGTGILIGVEGNKKYQQFKDNILLHEKIFRSP